jgi:hypothetical protein
MFSRNKKIDSQGENNNVETNKNKHVQISNISNLLLALASSIWALDRTVQINKGKPTTGM